MSSLKFKNKGLKMKENICANCEKFGNVSLFKGKLLCADCLSIIAIDLDIKNKMLSKKENNTLENDAKILLKNYGLKHQLHKTEEELAELLLEIIFYLRTGSASNNLINEIADVENTIRQIKIAKEYSQKEIDFICKQKNIIAIAGIETK